MAKSTKNPKITKDSPQRSVLKALSWRILATLTTMTITYFATGSLDWALVIGAFDVIIKLVLYYLHERLWTNIQWGKTWKRRAWRRYYRKMHRIEARKEQKNEKLIV